MEMQRIAAAWGNETGCGDFLLIYNVTVLCYIVCVSCKREGALWKAT